jgi:biotin carboxyl carrier protein
MKRLAITVNGKRYEVDVEVLQDDEAVDQTPPINPPKRAKSGAVASPPALNPAAKKPKLSVGDNRTLTSPVNGVVLEVAVTVGQEVKENEIVLVLEAMKMKTNIASPQTGTVASVAVKVGDSVETGQVLLTFA